MRFIVDQLHPLLIYLALSVVYVGFAIGTYLIATRISLPKEIRRHDVDRTIHGIYSIFLGFLIFFLWNNRDEALSNVINEASQLEIIWQNSQIFEKSTQEDLEQAIKQYAHIVGHHEWMKMREGQLHSQAQQTIDQIYRILRYYQPDGAHIQIFYGETIKALNALVEARNQRLGKLTRALPESWYVVVYGGVFIIILFNAFKVHRHQLHLTVHILLTLLLAFFMTSITVLSYPFSGSVGISNDPFQQGSWNSEDSANSSDKRDNFKG